MAKEVKGKVNRKLLITVGVIVILLIGFLVVRGFRGTGKTTPAAYEIKPVSVKLAAVQKGSISRRVNLAAKIVPATEVTIIPKVGGRVAEVTVDLGDTVRAGQTLIQLDDTDYSIQVQQMEANLELAVAGQKAAALNLTRYEQLAKTGAVAQHDLDSARTASEQADAQVKQAAAALANARNQVANTAICAPIDGLVSGRQVDIGEMVNTGGTVMTMVDISSVYAEFSIPESEISRLAQGQKIKVRVASVSVEPFEGTLTNLAPAADSSSKTFSARIKIENSAQKLKPGMFAEVELATEEHQQALLIPKEAIVEKAGQKLVYLAKEGKAVETRISTGLMEGEMAEVLEGLQEGDPVITAGQALVQNGSLVEIITA
ncbi:efflux RND transporter periplasmic adaptor subunit [Pelotomaculum propionicicum]|uniref:Multidrug resistance protein MdtA n=1 Tax=Pelotomaculum propionicicum TaxID=258475 RepID=A0A4Y7RT86_9FIRM|nr:efflux RND transporter periplasmic adaptor subunit [Pelotomaculum propionicicum]NLI13498.1 efflux RND transporter periplasmic adaptor subunit [Peptococcaceae bacterium]TEB12195.1 Multidrug resistance protein MdtA [Pelotomaculum propionicicum]